jgi:hypothetical protein
MKSYLFEHYKKKYASGGKKVPVRKTGMWYQKGDVVVPSNEITMKGPKGEKDYFDSPIVGIGLQSGQSQVMLPGEDYFFPEDEAVLEKKMQMGAKAKPSQMTPEQQARFNAYMAENSNSTIQTPEWLNLSSGATRFARRFNNMETEELSRMPGDISKDVKSAFERGLDYSLEGDLGSLGRVSTEGNYNPFGTNSLESLYSGLTYQNNSPNLGIRLSPQEQEITLKGKGNQLKLKRNVTDEETINELAFSLSPIGQALNVYGRGTFEGLGDLPGINRKKPYSLEGINPEYNIQAGVRGEVGPVNYNVRGNYNPETGYRYNADAELSLLKNRLNLRGDVSGSKETGLQSLSAEARARLAKGLSVKAGYSKSKDQPGSYNIGFSYNKAFQGGGMSIPGVNGTVVSSMPSTIRDAYKKKKKK